MIKQPTYRNEGETAVSDYKDKRRQGLRYLARIIARHHANRGQQVNTLIKPESNSRGEKDGEKS